MALPETYTELTLTQYMIGVLKDVGVMLGWTTQASYQDAIDQTIEALGVTDIVAATGGAKIRSIARMFAWKSVVDTFAGMYDYTADGGSFQRSQLYKQAKDQLRDARLDARPYLVSNRVGATGISIPNEAVF